LRKHPLLCNRSERDHNLWLRNIHAHIPCAPIGRRRKVIGGKVLRDRRESALLIPEERGRLPMHAQDPFTAIRAREGGFRVQACDRGGRRGIPESGK